MSSLFSQIHQSSASLVSRTEMLFCACLYEIVAKTIS